MKNTVIGVGLLFCSGALFAADYEVGHQALQEWNSDAMNNAPAPLRIWLLVMVSCFAAGLFFVGHRVIARWVTGGFVVAFVGSGLFSSALGIVPLSGYVALVHLVCWSPGLYLLLTRRPFLNEKGVFAVWSGVITLVILISFFFDIRDASIYLDHVSGLNMFS